MNSSLLFSGNAAQKMSQIWGKPMGPPPSARAVVNDEPRRSSSKRRSNDGESRKSSSSKRRSSKSSRNDQQPLQERGQMDFMANMAEGMKPGNLLANSDIFRGRILDHPQMMQNQQRPTPPRPSPPTSKFGADVSTQSHYRASPALCNGCKTDPCCCDFSYEPDNTVDFGKLIQQCRTPLFVAIYGLVADYAGITTVDEMPCIINMVSNDIIELFPNTASGFTIEDVANAFGFNSGSWLNWLAPVAMANLPGGLSSFNGLYNLIGTPENGNSSYKLLSSNWVECKKAPGVGSIVQILLGSSAALFRITELDDCTQQWLFEPIGIRALIAALVTHMYGHGSKYQYWLDDCKKKGDGDNDSKDKWDDDGSSRSGSDSDSDSSRSRSGSKSWSKYDN